jgi:hypothetical protein
MPLEIDALVRSVGDKKVPHRNACAGIFKQSMGARNRVGIGLSYRTARLNRMAELVPWNRFLGSLKFKNSGSACGHLHRHALLPGQPPEAYQYSPLKGNRRRASLSFLFQRGG